MNAFNDFYKTNGGSHDTVVEGPSLTRQEFAEECDINALMARYDRHVVGGPGGLPPPVGGAYVDFSSMPSDLMEYMAKMKEADAAFMTLPAVVRKEFDNDPLAFVDYASDPANLEQMREWGLAPKPPVEVLQPLPSSSPAPAAAVAQEPPKQG